VNEKLAPNSLRFVEAAGGRVIRNLIQSRQAIGILPEYLCLDIRSDPHFRDGAAAAAVAGVGFS